MQNEIDLAAESFGVNSKTSEGGNLDIQVDTLKRMSQAVGHDDAKCGRNFVQRFKQKAKLRDKDTGEERGTLALGKRSNLSHQRQNAMCVEKVQTQFNMVGAKFQEHYDQVLPRPPPLHCVSCPWSCLWSCPWSCPRTTRRSGPSPRTAVSGPRGVGQINRMRWPCCATVCPAVSRTN